MKSGSFSLQISLKYQEGCLQLIRTIFYEWSFFAISAKKISFFRKSWKSPICHVTRASKFWNNSIPDMKNALIGHKKIKTQLLRTRGCKKNPNGKLFNLKKKTGSTWLSPHGRLRVNVWFESSSLIREWSYFKTGDSPSASGNHDRSLPHPSHPTPASQVRPSETRMGIPPQFRQGSRDVVHVMEIPRSFGKAVEMWFTWWWFHAVSSRQSRCGLRDGDSTQFRQGSEIIVSPSSFHGIWLCFAKAVTLLYHLVRFMRFHSKICLLTGIPIVL